MANTIDIIAKVYQNERITTDEHVESFAQVVERVGIAPFKAAVYA